MRELKFRAWNGKEKRTVEIPAMGTWDVFEDWKQYTGLKDCNGTEIYEGDIVRWENYRGENVSEIVFLDGAFCTRPQTNDEELHLITQCNYIEVIGNIYENPDLLE